MMNIEDIVREEPWLSNLKLDIYGHGVYVIGVFEPNDNGTDTVLASNIVEGLMKCKQIPKAETPSSFNKGMGDGFYVRRVAGSAKPEIGYTTGLIVFDGDVEVIMKMLHGKFDLLVKEIRGANRIEKGIKTFESCKQL